MADYFEDSVCNPSGCKRPVVRICCKRSIVDELCCFFNRLNDRVGNQYLRQKFLCQSWLSVFINFFQTPRGELVALAMDEGVVDHVEYVEHGTRVVARVPSAHVDRFAPYAAQPQEDEV